MKTTNSYSRVVYSSHNGFRIKSEIKLSEYNCDQDLVSDKTKNQIGFSMDNKNGMIHHRFLSIQALLVISLLFFLPGITLVAAVDLPKTGQTFSYAAGDDGNIQAGLTWPSPRFQDNEDGTITDNLTGLMWIKDGSCLGHRNWGEAFNMIETLNTLPVNFNCSDYSATYDDWRLPNINELVSLLTTGDLKWLHNHGFVNIRDGYISSTTVAHNTTRLWSIQPFGIMHPFSKQMTTYGAWAVRGTSNGPATVLATGQKISYMAGDDGDRQEGEPWPSPRFADNGDGTITDNLTGIMWMQDAGTVSIGQCVGGSKSWQEALDYVACLNSIHYLGYYDWRLPNRKEFESLTDFSKYNPALPGDHLFSTVHSLPAPAPGPDYYWTSTTHTANNSAWAYFSFEGSLQDEFKSGSVTGKDSVWPVRGGIIDPPILNELVHVDRDKIVTKFFPAPVAGGPAGTFIITAIFTNTNNTSIPIFKPFFKVAELSGGNLLLNADGGAEGAGATLTPDVGDDLLSPGESVTVNFEIGLQKPNSFSFSVDLYGGLH
ncbi:MAG: hypothetical protein SCALA701_01190 [Candidatus Scalindua sp.]|nr:DUF1566 domain-containing protein [Planctomycetota bacterium]GJQ57318.1 MAG: hypothetical protein SCALA701_01190 [Candidatus Scalindua sp.]